MTYESLLQELDRVLGELQETHRGMVEARRRAERTYFSLVDEGYAMHYTPLPWLPHGHWAWTPEQRTTLGTKEI